MITSLKSSFPDTCPRVWADKNHLHARTPLFYRVLNLFFHSRAVVAGRIKKHMEIMKKSGMESSVLIKRHLKRTSGLRKWADTIKVVEEYPMLSRVPAKNDYSKKDIWTIRIAGLFLLYNMIHVQI